MKSLHTALLCCAVTGLLAGCNKPLDSNTMYKASIDGFYSGHPACLWQHSVQFPVQVGASDDAKTRQYDSLLDQGLLTRTTTEKKIIIISKREINYDLSGDGRSAWTPDPNLPGFGDFCYGFPTVSRIESATPTDGKVGATTTVNYLYSLSNAPAWAQKPEVETAFPQIKTDLLGNVPTTVTLEETTSGWQVKVAPPISPQAQTADAISK